MAERIYIKNKQGELDSLEETPFALEDDLQALLAEHPELIDGERIRPDDPRRWILIKREKGIAKTPDAADHWALDLLLIDQDAIPTLVEVKRGSNSEVRRKVVGQMLEYASHATGSWSVGDIRRDFEGGVKAQKQDPVKVIAKLLQTEEEPNVDGFWEDVGANLAARRIRLLFAADRIPSELERIVTFLNQQMQNVEVLAFEIKQFSAGVTQTLVPRIIGLTAAAPSKTAARTKLTRESFLDEFTGDEVRAAATRLLDTAAKAGASLSWGSAAVSIRMRCQLWDQPVTVAWLYPPHKVGWAKNFTFGWGGQTYERPQILTALLQEWSNQFAAYDSVEDISSKDIIGWALPHDVVAQNIGKIEARLAKVLSDLKSLEAGEGG